MRIWQISSTLGRAEVRSNARTIGELKSDLRSNGVEYENMSLAIRANRGGNYSNDNTPLPPHDPNTPDILILTPNKNKNGVC